MYGRSTNRVESEKMDDNRDRSGVKKKTASACDVEALKKCLEQHKSDYNKCQSQIEAFKSSCSLKNPSDS
ncbi:hypothetical protein L1987_43098 [Smallanthus sonchifolius]|uniref:Uncharacterized protein n=1 Tax=Smallanthus sonchifolius TaxID=185202 RepID=A0ACB9GKT5_9ASTR|nr:hypothetical protein L1987_43098 [Smallanthus sonchifolius]